MNWEIVIGLEVHIQLMTQSKLFSCASTAVSAEPNTQACAIDLGLPGILPVLNKDAVMMAIKFGLAIDADIFNLSSFARKHYFYPDLPKGYQITQHNYPILKNGHLDIIIDDNQIKQINITHAHLEEDAGKSLHEDFHGMTGIDFNRAGEPLLEIVSAPQLRSSNEAVTYLKTLHTLIRYLEICDGNLQDGSFRVDANISVRPLGTHQFNTKTEIKNMNSFRFVEKAINFEAKRQINLIAAGAKVIHETRLYDENKNETRAMRIKEEAHDYRYFPEPDLLPIEISNEWINTLKLTLPELPQERYQRFIQNYHLTSSDANLLVTSHAMGNYFEKVLSLSNANPKLAASWILGELSAVLNDENTNIQQSPINEKQLAELLIRIEDKTISGKMAKSVFEAMLKGEGSTDKIIETKRLKQITNLTTIEKIVEKIIRNYPNEAKEYQSGKTKLLEFFIGKVMLASKEKANPEQVNKILKRLLSN